MTCRDVVHLVEAIAAGDLDVEPDVRAHIESCPQCAAALASAHRIEAALQARSSPDAPGRFAAAVLARVRNERWSHEQRVDRIFNIAIGLAAILVAGSLAALTNVTAVVGAAGWIWDMFAQVSGEFVRQAAPAIATYVAAAGVLMSALVMWWWAERWRSLL
jgi:anti-sigma factor RsiW